MVSQPGALNALDIYYESNKLFVRVYCVVALEAVRRTSHTKHRVRNSIFIYSTASTPTKNERVFLWLRQRRTSGSCLRK